MEERTGGASQVAASQASSPMEEEMACVEEVDKAFTFSTFPYSQLLFKADPWLGTSRQIFGSGLCGVDRLRRFTTGLTSSGAGMSSSSKKTLPLGRGSASIWLLHIELLMKHKKRDSPCHPFFSAQALTADKVAEA